MSDTDQTERKVWLSTLSKARPDRLVALVPDLPRHDVLRGPECGAVMVRGRVGGIGEPFNIGEMTVTRCSVRLADGTVGHAWVQGRDKDHAMRAAVVDAMLQTEAAAGVRASVIDVLHAEQRAARNLRDAKAAATRVEFFTMVRGDDA